MKKQILSIVLLVLAFMLPIDSVYAQCSADTTITNPGVFQYYQYCFSQNGWTSVVWQIRVYDKITVNGQAVQVDSLQIDSIVNLPNGLKWTTNKQTTDPVSNNKFNRLENGCIWIYGVAIDSVASYHTDVHALVFLQGSAQPIGEYLGTIGSQISTRVTDSTSEGCLPPDSTIYIPASNTKYTATYTTSNSGISDISENVANLTNYPNPFNNNTEVTYTTSQPQQVTFRVYDLVGTTVHQETLVAVPGKNTVTFNRKDLTNGIYFYSISDGAHSVTSKMVIAE